MSVCRIRVDRFLRIAFCFPLRSFGIKTDTLSMGGALQAQRQFPRNRASLQPEGVLVRPRRRSAVYPERHVEAILRIKGFRRRARGRKKFRRLGITFMVDSRRYTGPTPRARLAVRDRRRALSLGSVSRECAAIRRIRNDAADSHLCGSLDACFGSRRTGRTFLQSGHRL